MSDTPQNLFGNITPQPLHWHDPEPPEIPNVIVHLTPEQWQANRDYAKSDCPFSDYKEGYYDPVALPEPMPFEPVSAFFALVSDATESFPVWWK